jgi:adenine phosphoribosyltransferase
MPGPELQLRRPASPRKSLRIAETRTYTTTVGSQPVELPLVEVAEGVAIALMICVDHGVAFSERAGRELATRLAPEEPEVVVSVATMGIPLAIEATRALGLDDYVILHKTPKIHLGDTWVEPVRSITTDSAQTLRLDPARVGAVRGRRVAVVDDVISTGGSMRAAIDLLRRAGAEPVVIGACLTEGVAWRATLGDDADKVRTLGTLPLFRLGADGSVTEDWGD